MISYTSLHQVGEVSLCLRVLAIYHRLTSNSRVSYPSLSDRAEIIVVHCHTWLQSKELFFLWRYWTLNAQPCNYGQELCHPAALPSLEVPVLSQFAEYFHQGFGTLIHSSFTPVIVTRWSLSLIPFVTVSYKWSLTYNGLALQRSQENPHSVDLILRVSICSLASNIQYSCKAGRQQ